MNDVIFLNTWILYVVIFFIRQAIKRYSGIQALSKLVIYKHCVTAQCDP